MKKISAIEWKRIHVWSLAIIFFISFHFSIPTVAAEDTPPSSQNDESGGGAAASGSIAIGSEEIPEGSGAASALMPPEDETQMTPGSDPQVTATEQQASPAPITQDVAQTPKGIGAAAAPAGVAVSSGISGASLGVAAAAAAAVAGIAAFALGGGGGGGGSRTTSNH